MDRPTQGVDDPARGIGEVAKRGEPARDREIAQDHRVARVLDAREELRQAFRPPQRQVRVAHARVALEHLARQAELKHVHQLVPQGVAELGIAAGERQRDALLQELRDAEQPLRRHERQDVGLLEIGVRRIDDERDAPRGMVVEASLQDPVALFGEGERDATELLLFRIVVQVHVLAAQHVPVEAAILDLVLAEVAELGGPRAGKQREQDRSAERRLEWVRSDARHDVSDGCSGSSSQSLKFFRARRWIENGSRRKRLRKLFVVEEVIQ